jgi:DNA repair protein RecO (recombination protein O)
MPYYKSNALILRTIPYSKTSQIVGALTREFGRRAFLAKGSRRSGNPFDGPMDILYQGEAVFVDRASSGLDLLTAFALDGWFPDIRRHDQRIRSAQTVLELIDKSTAVDDPCPNLYDLALSCLEEIAAIDVQYVGAPRCRFELGVLDNLGRAPVFDHCVACERPRPEGKSAIASPQAGGIVCRSCRSGMGRGHTLKAEALDWLEQVQQEPLKRFDSSGNWTIISAQVEGFLAAGHAATITGSAVFEPFVARHGLPVVVAGFEPLEIGRAHV